MSENKGRFKKGHKSLTPKMEKHYNWKGGRRINGYGYVEIKQKDGTERVEHRLVAEKALGRPLKRSEVVHHINGDKTDNRNTNLIISSSSYHHWLERKMAHLYKQEHFG